MRKLTVTIEEPWAGRTVDTLLRHRLGLSGSSIKRAKAIPGGILLDEVMVYTSAVTTLGQTLTVVLGDSHLTPLEPVRGPLDIVYEDADIVVVNKQAGVPVHPGPGERKHTIGNYLAEYDRSCGHTGGFHAVNRLDRGTSGLMVVARHPHAQEILKTQLHTAAFCRSYLAVCQGVPEPLKGTVDAPIARTPGSPLMRAVVPGGARSVTHYETIAVGGGRALIRVIPETGRTHQIRVHLAHLGHPLTGDFLYGMEEKTLIGRAALHSARLELAHPITGEALAWETPLPPDMAALIEETGVDVK